MNHQLIKKILKIVTMIAFVGIIVHQLYNIIVNGGSPSKSDEEPIGEDEEPIGEDEVGEGYEPTPEGYDYASSKCTNPISQPQSEED